MSENPYQSPSCLDETVVADTSLRTRAILAFRISGFVLLVPAIYNYWAFDARAIAPLPDDLANLCRGANILGLVVVCMVIWFFGVSGLEALAHFLRFVFARGTDRTAWATILYESLRRMIYLAVPGAILWMIWVFGFYQLQADFYVLSWTVGVAAHLLGACWYLPLLYRWYSVAVSRSAPVTPQN